MAIVDEREIAAPVERVWELTMDLESWPEMAPSMSKVELLDAGPLAVGHRARVTQPPARPSVWTVEVLEAPHRFVWSTSWRGLCLRAGHELFATETGCRNRLSVEVSGLFGGLFERVMRRRVAAAIAAENAGFAARAEA